LAQRAHQRAHTTDTRAHGESAEARGISGARESESVRGTKKEGGGEEEEEERHSQHTVSPRARDDNENAERLTGHEGQKGHVGAVP
jgi:hypothetical protein